jgi:formylmethanofuran dehydrogenase subunit C
MSTLRLTLREAPAQRVDLSPLTPDHLTGKTSAEIGAIELALGNARVRVDELFSLSGDFVSELAILNGCDRLDRLGEGMTHGRITVDGSAGAYLGAGMSGGVIEVHGSAGAYAATGMKGGMIHVTGNAGDFLAAALPGERGGMQGGTVVVGGDAGDRAGDRMRRGVLLIEGNAGDYCASRMVAGTIAVAGTVGRCPGFAMRRGTLLLLKSPPAVGSTFSDCGEHPLSVITLMVRSWRTLPGRFATLSDTRVRARRYVGDLANGGLGEILLLV